MLEETLQKFRLDPETEARVRVIAEQFDLVGKIESGTNIRKALIGIWGIDRNLVHDVYESAMVRVALSNYVVYSQQEIQLDRSPRGFTIFLRCAIKNGDSFIVEEQLGIYRYVYN